MITLCALKRYTSKAYVRTYLQLVLNASIFLELLSCLNKNNADQKMINELWGGDRSKIKTALVFSCFPGYFRQ